MVREYEYEGARWDVHDWNIGESISKNKVNNLETGVQIAISLADNILKEIGGYIDPETGHRIVVNTTRLDKIQEWITGADDGDYGDSTLNIAARLNNIEGTDDTQNEKLGNLESTSSTLENAVKAIKTWITGSNEGEYTGTNIAARLNSVDSKNSEQDTTLSALTTRLGNVETKNTGQDAALNMIKRWLTGSETGTYSGTSIIARLSNIEASDTSQNSHLNSLQNQTDSILAELGGTAGSGIENSRLDELDKWITGYDNPTPAQKYVNSSSISARLDSIEEELLGSADSLTNSRLDDLEKEIGGTRDVGHGYTNSRIDGLAAEDSANKVRLTELEAIVGGHSSTDPSYRTHDARLGQLENNIGSDLLPNIPISTRVTTVENELGIGGQSDTTIAGRIRILEECCAEIKSLDIESLYAFIVNEIGQIVRMEYKIPYTISSSTIELAPGIVDENDTPRCIHYEEATVTCLGNNIWNNSYFTNTPGIENNGQYFFGHASAFKTAFNSFFGNIEWREGVKISFDFNFFDPLKALRLVYDYGTTPIEDTRAYNNENESWRRISFLNLQNQDGTEMPIYGIKTLFYGQEADDDIVFIKNVQVEINPRTRDVEPQNPFNDDWTIVLPNTMYGATIDLINRKIYETWGHIASYNGEDVGDNWISTTGTLEQGAEVVYELDEPIVHKITIYGSVVTQGFNTVPMDKIIIKFNRNVTI